MVEHLKNVEIAMPRFLLCPGHVRVFDGFDGELLLCSRVRRQRRHTPLPLVQNRVSEVNVRQLNLILRLLVFLLPAFELCGNERPHVLHRPRTQPRLHTRPLQRQSFNGANGDDRCHPGGVLEQRSLSKERIHVQGRKHPLGFLVLDVGRSFVEKIEGVANLTLRHDVRPLLKLDEFASLRDRGEGFFRNLSEHGHQLQESPGDVALQSGHHMPHDLDVFWAFV
mmetsp:Transcript_56187/g.122142  ORF Transcript_56187/g.122142 Transcript_56187/m.122142 type:complete len:224 (-) Transcript_56187:496-1167(-)